MKKSYLSTPEAWFPELGLGLKLWQGDMKSASAEWLRWVDENGRMLETGEEQRLIAEDAHTTSRKCAAQAASAKKIAKQEKQRAELLAAKLRELGVDPDKLTAVE